MERLTERNVKLSQIKKIPHEAFYYKLQEYENFMEEQGFENLEDLTDSIKNIERIMLKNSALNQKWKILKKFIENRIDCAPYEVQARLLSDILDKMQEIERDN